MNTENNNPKTLTEAVRYFADLDKAQQYFVNVRWSAGVCCPHCGSMNVHYLANQRRWKCNEKHPRCQFSAKVGTVFEESPLGLDKWLVVVWLEVNAKNSISSYEVARALGVTQKSAWFMLHRVRHAMHVGSFEKKMSGIVEADETFVGGKAANMHKGRHARCLSEGWKGKTAVMGLLQRHSKNKHSVVRTAVIANRRAETVQPIIRQNVQTGEIVFTDELSGYRGLSDAFAHRFVNHAERYVHGIVHTNGLENFWSLFKRCIKGTHVSIEPFHLAAYVDSEAFRFNNRELNDAGRFAVALPSVVGKRITYSQLIGKFDAECRIDADNIAENGESLLPN